MFDKIKWSFKRSAYFYNWILIETKVLFKTVESISILASFKTFEGLSWKLNEVPVIIQYSLFKRATRSFLQV